MTGFITASVERSLAAVAQFSLRFRWLMLAVIVLSIGLALNAARSLTVDSNLMSLLPEAFPSVQGLQAYRERGGTVGYVAVLIKGPSREELETFAAAAQTRLESLETVQYIEYRSPASFFEDRLLYYLELDELEEFADQIEDRVAWEKGRANPLFVDLGDDGPPELALTVDKDRLPPGLSKRSKSKSPLHFDDSGKVLLMLVKPKGLASDLSYAQQVVEDVKSKLPLVPGYSEMQIEYGGRFVKRVDQQSRMKSDLSVSSWSAIVLILLYLGLHFRRASGVLVSILPLAVGLIWTFGAASLLFGELNILTAFVGAILMGLGIDHGLHLLERFQSARADGESVEGAIATTFGHTGRAVVLAAVTTAIGFAGLGVSEFRAFREFGWIAALGGVLVVLAYTLCLPPLLAWFGSPRRASNSKLFERYASMIARHRKGVLLASSLLIVALVAQIQSLQFDYDFKALDGGQGRSFQLDKTIDGILGRSQASVALLTQDEADAQAAALELRARQKTQGDQSSVDFVVTTRDLIPTEQADKRIQLKRIAQAITNIDPETLPAKEQGAFRSLKRASAALPFTLDELPKSIQKELNVDSDQPGSLALVFPAVSLSDGHAILRLANELRDIKLPSGNEAVGAGETLVLADILSLVLRETPKVMSITLIMVFLCLLFFLQNFRQAALSYAPALVSVFATLGAAGLFGLKLNYLNIIFIPVLFGLAVDSGVHLVTHKGGSREARIRAVAQTARAVVGASLTTAAGFGALATVQHPGLASLGKLALIGVTVSLLASLVWLSSLIGFGTQAPAAAVCTVADGYSPRAEAVQTVWD